MTPAGTPASPSDFTLEAPGHYSHLANIRQAVLDAGHRAGLPLEKSSQLEMAVDEACANIIEHSYGPDRKQQAQNTHDALRLHFITTPGALTIEIYDHGAGFDFNGTTGVPPECYLDERRQRGLGMYIIRCFVDEAAYERGTPSGNCLRLTKRA